MDVFASRPRRKFIKPPSFGHWPISLVFSAPLDHNSRHTRDTSTNYIDAKEMAAVGWLLFSSLDTRKEKSEAPGRRRSPQIYEQVHVQVQV